MTRSVIVRADAVDGDDGRSGRRSSRRPVQATVIEGHRGDPALLRTRHGFGRVAAPRRSPRLHFHEDERWPVLGDDVNFSKARAEPGGKNCVPAFRQRLAGEQFALFSERLAIGGFRHELARSKGRAVPPVLFTPTSPPFTPDFPRPSLRVPFAPCAREVLSDLELDQPGGVGLEGLAAHRVADPQVELAE